MFSVSLDVIKACLGFNYKHIYINYEHCLLLLITHVNLSRLKVI